MANFDPFRQNLPQNPPGPGYPVPGAYPPPPAAPYPTGQMPPGYAPAPAYPQPAYGQPAYPQPTAYAPQPPVQPAYGQQYAGSPQPGYYPPPPAPVAYGQPAYPQPAYPQPVAPQNYPPNPYAPPPPVSMPVAPVPVAYAPPPQPMPMPTGVPDLPMSARAVPMQPAPVTVKPVAVRPAAPAPVAHAPVAPVPAPRPVQPVAKQAAPVTPARAPVPLPPAGTPGVAPTKPGAAPSNRPVLAPVKPKDDKPKVDTEPAEEAPPKDPTEKVIKGAPPWMVSLVVHMVLLIILALITIASITNKNIEIVSEPVYAEELGEQIIEQDLQSPEFENMEIENPALSFDTKPVDDPLAAPPILIATSVDATSSVDTIEAPSIGMALDGRNEGSKKALLAAYGGNATTEAAVEAGLQWLIRNQQKDGGWSLTGPFSEGGGVENKVSATAMALLAFQGAGHTTKTGKHKAIVEKGWSALEKFQNADGYFECDAAHHHRLYAQAQASIAACEIYGMTKDEKFRPIAQKALDFAIKAQAPEGGWRYEPKIDSDTSVTGWFVMALQSGRMAGLEVASPNVDLTNKFLDSVQANGGSHYMYKPGMAETLTMTAEGLLCRQYLGWDHNDERMKRGLDYVTANTINYGDANVYYWYYATQAAHHMGGHHWKQWNQVMIQTVPQAQLKTGNEKGSWSPSGDRWGTHGGRLFVTCLHIFMLEAYYRHLPLYKHQIQAPKGTAEAISKALNSAGK